MKCEFSTSAEAEQVALVLREAALWLEEKGKALWRSQAMTTESVMSDVAAGRFLVARHDGEIVGVVRFQLEDPDFWPEVKDSSSAFLHRLAVRRSVAGTGVSQSLLSAAADQAYDLSKRFLRLDCEASRPELRRLYETFGFAFHSERRIGSKLFARYELNVARTLST